MPVLEKPHLTSLAAYLAAEESAPYKSEFYHGEVVRMSGVDDTHNILSANLLCLIGNALYEQLECGVRASRQLVQSADGNCFFYPDLTVVCGPPQFREKPRPAVLLNPLLVVEVLSESTEKRDRNDKLLFYLRIPALRHYLLIDSERMRAELYSRPDANTSQWLYESVEGPEAAVNLTALQIALPLADVYSKVALPPPAPLPEFM